MKKTFISWYLQEKFIYILGSENILLYIIFETDQKYIWENVM
jgi:hypothetical protein